MGLQFDLSFSGGALRRPPPKWWTAYRTSTGLVPDLVLDFAAGLYGVGTGPMGLVQSALPLTNARLGRAAVDGGGAGLLIEPARSNLVSRSIARPTWGPVGPVTLTALSEARGGVFPGLEITSAGVAWHRAGPGSITFQAGLSYAMTLWYGAASAQMLKGTVYSTATSPASNLEIQGAPGQMVAVVQNGGQITDLRNDQLASGFYRMRCRFSLNQTVTTNWGFGAGTTTPGDTVTIYGLQIEAGPEATGYIMTDGSVAGRAADLLGLDADGWGALGQGVLRVTGEANGAGDTALCRVIDQTGRSLTIMRRAGGAIVLRHRDGAVITDTPAGPIVPRELSFDAALMWQAGLMALSVNGQPAQTMAFAGFDQTARLEFHDATVGEGAGPARVARLIHYPTAVGAEQLAPLSQ